MSEPWFMTLPTMRAGSLVEHRVDDDGCVLAALLDLERLAGVQLTLRRVVLVEVVGDSVEVLTDGDMEALHGIALGDEPGVVLGVVLGRLGQVVAQAAEQLGAHQVVVGHTALLRRTRAGPDRGRGRGARGAAGRPGG